MTEDRGELWRAAAAKLDEQYGAPPGGRGRHDAIQSYAEAEKRLEAQNLLLNWQARKTWAQAKDFTAAGTLSREALHQYAFDVLDGLMAMDREHAVVREVGRLIDNNDRFVVFDHVCVATRELTKAVDRVRNHVHAETLPTLGIEQIDVKSEDDLADVGKAIPDLDHTLTAFAVLTEAAASDANNGGGGRGFVEHGDGSVDRAAEQPEPTVDSSPSPSLDSMDVTARMGPGVIQYKLWVTRAQMAAHGAPVEEIFVETDGDAILVQAEDGARGGLATLRLSHGAAEVLAHRLGIRLERARWREWMARELRRAELRATDQAAQP